MNIAIIGTGSVGKALGLGWANAGHAVTFGSRRAGSPELRSLLENDGVQVQTPVESVVRAEVVVLATPWLATETVVKSLGDLSGKVLIDCTNPLGPGLTFEGGKGASGGEQVADWAKGAHVVKAFNTTGADNMRNSEIDGRKLAMFICGDDASAKKVVTELVEVLGFEAVDNGPLSHARYLEALAMLWITQAFKNQWGPGFGFVIVRR